MLFFFSFLNAHKSFLLLYEVVSKSEEVSCIFKAKN